jgi:UDP-N-acetylmuramate dehydrogenase
MGLEPNNLVNRRQIILAARKKAGALLKPNDSTHTAGSFFKNPAVDPKQVDQLMANEEFGQSRQQIMQQNQVHGGSNVRVSAAHVLLAAGYERGQTWGPVRLHPNHILKLENTGGATANQIYAVVQEIIQTVQAKLGITLEPEVQILGQF